ncbi:MAG: hypothetical protein CMP20_04095 [Rickettsiales bacterium]|nr:hypothetical protein [Rickettsiales bacterium]
MTKRKSKYQRCKRCKELVLDAVNCANCVAKSREDYVAKRDHKVDGARPYTTLDLQEGNSRD